MGTRRVLPSNGPQAGVLRGELCLPVPRTGDCGQGWVSTETAFLRISVTRLSERGPGEHPGCPKQEPEGPAACSRHLYTVDGENVGSCVFTHFMFVVGWCRVA